MDIIAYKNFINSSVDLAFNIIFNSSEVLESKKKLMAYSFVKERYKEDLEEEFIIKYLQNKDGDNYKIPTIEDIIYIINKICESTCEEFSAKTRLDYYISIKDEQNKEIMEFLSAIL